MQHRARDILNIFDACATAFTFPMLDNGYLYLAASRPSVFRSPDDWAMVIEVFGYSPRAGHPDVHVHTFGSRLHDRRTAQEFRSEEAFRQYLANNPHNESRFFFPGEFETIQDLDCDEYVAEDAGKVVLRGHEVALPDRATYALHGIELEQAPRVQVFELCRYLASVGREAVLATEQERRASLPPGMNQILQLEEWHHPDLANQERPSDSETFQSLARVLESGIADAYRPTRPANTHWKHWPDAGCL
jgi:hypothetical protein